MRADGYAENTVRSYRRALADFGAWLARRHPGLSPTDAAREHIRGWLVATREQSSSGSARSMYAGVRHFYRWCLAEGEIQVDPTEGVKTPAPNDQTTPVLTEADLRALLDTAKGRDFIAVRDTAIIMLFIYGGLRLAELSGLAVDDVNIRDRAVIVAGKGANRSGPRMRAVPIQTACARALDRYLRVRRRHPYAEAPQLWLGDRGRARITSDGIDAMLRRRGRAAGVDVHAHQLRHTWASRVRAVGGSEGDLMVLGGWRNRAMLDRYGRAAAADRARDAYWRLPLWDRL